MALTAILSSPMRLVKYGIHAIRMVYGKERQKECVESLGMSGVRPNFERGLTQNDAGCFSSILYMGICLNLVNRSLKS